MTFDISGRSVRWPDGSDGTIQQEGFDREGSGSRHAYVVRFRVELTVHRPSPEVCVSRLPLMSGCPAETTKKRPKRGAENRQLGCPTRTDGRIFLSRGCERFRHRDVRSLSARGTAGTQPSPRRCEPAGCRRPAPDGSRSCLRSPGTRASSVNLSGVAATSASSPSSDSTSSKS